MNFHQRSFSEQPQPLRPQQSPSLANSNNYGNQPNGDTNGTSVIMDTTPNRVASSGGSGGEILHSDSQQSLDRLFNPTSMPSYTPLRDRNLPASFFNPPWKTNNRDGGEDNVSMGEAPVSFHSRSVSFDQRQTSKAPIHRRNINLHMRTQSTLAPMTSLMGQAAAIAESSPSAISGASSNGHLNSDFGSSEVISSNHPHNGLHRSAEFGAHLHDPNQSHPQQQQQQQQQQSQFIHQNNHAQQPFVATRATIVHGHSAHQQPVTSYSLDGPFFDSQQYHQPLENNNMSNHHVQSHELKFHVAHSRYVTPISGLQNNQQAQQQQPPISTATAVAPQHGTTNQLGSGADGFSSSGSTMSHSCSNSDFHSGSCSSLHSRSQSCQSSVLDSSMSNLGISGSSNDLTRDPSAAPMFDYAATNTPIVQQQPSMPNRFFNQPAQQQQIFGTQTAAMNHHQQHLQDSIPSLHQHQAPMEERRCGY